MGINGLYDQNSDPTRTEFKQAETLKDELVMRKLSQLGIQFSEPLWPDGIAKEDILPLVDHDRVLNSFCYSTVNKLFRQSLGTLFLDFDQPLGQFPSDQIYWNNEWFTHIFKVYGENNRHMLSDQKQTFLVLRSALQNLVQTRSVRLELADLTKLVIAFCPFFCNVHFFHCN